MKWLPNLVLAAMLVLLMFSSVLSAPAHAQFQDETFVATYPGAAPIWTTLNAPATSNYPGGNEIFNVFVVNTALSPKDNETIQSMTLTAPFQSNFGIGLPTTIMPGQAFLGTIALQIPTNFTQSSFTANLVGYAKLWNGTGYESATLTGSAIVQVLALSPQSTTQSTTTVQSGRVSTSFFEAGVAIPSIIAVVLLILVVRARSGSKSMGM